MRLPSPLALISMVFALCTLYLMEHFGFWTGFLSHPFWSQKVNWTGMGIGFAVSLILHMLVKVNRRRLFLTALVFAVAAIGLFFLTSISKETFAASFAENQLAGKLWFFGFMAYIAALFTLASFAVTALLTEKN